MSMEKPQLNQQEQQIETQDVPMERSEISESPSISGHVDVGQMTGGIAAGVYAQQLQVTATTTVHNYGNGQALPSLEDTRTAYLAYLIEHFDGVEPKGIPQTVRSVRLPLEEVYVSLTAERETSRLWEPEPPEMRERERGVPRGSSVGMVEAPAQEDARELRRLRMPETRSEPVDLPRVVRESARAILLGDPGAGKTTLMRFLAVCFAKAMQKGEPQTRDAEQAIYGDTRLPILLRVAEYADAFRKDSAPNLHDFLPRAFGDSRLPTQALVALFDDALQNGRAIVLLDGLDEVADAGRRIDIACSIDGFVSGMGNGNRILVTSRIAGYKEARLGGVFQQYTLRDMERGQIERFLNRWCTSCERFHHAHAGDAYITGLAQKQIKALLAAIDGNKGVRRLATNPLLLTIRIVHGQRFHAGGASYSGASASGALGGTYPTCHCQQKFP